jgi:hypothetical protein
MKIFNSHPTQQSEKPAEEEPVSGETPNQTEENKPRGLVGSLVATFKEKVLKQRPD